MMNNNVTTLDDALLMEYNEFYEGLDIEDMMSSMLSEYQNETNEKTDKMDYFEEKEYIRKLMIVTKFLTKERDELKEMKSRVVESWDDRINSKEKQINSIREYIKYFIENENEGKALEFEVGKASSRVTAPSIRMKKLTKDQESALIKQLKEQDILDHFSKISIDNKTLVDSFKAQIKREAEVSTAKEVSEMKAKGEKVTKTKENEILKKNTAQAFLDNKTKLPDYIEFVEESSSVTLTFKK